MHDRNSLSLGNRTLVALACAAGVAFALASGALLAQTPLPPEQSEGNINYRVGGIGLDEARAMRNAASEYPVMLTFVEQIGGKAAFTADVDVSIQGAGTQLETTAEGPLMLLALPPGSYEVVATLNGQTRSQRVSVQDGESRNYVFSWPAASEQATLSNALPRG